MSDINWFVSPETKRTFDRLVADMENYEEYSDAYMALVDEIRRLPNFPLNFSEEHDTIHIEVVRAVRVGYRKGAHNGPIPKSA